MSKNCCSGLCRKSDRKYKCIDCDKNICGLCSIKYEKDFYCIDCFTLNVLPKVQYKYYDVIYNNPKPSLC